MLAVEKKTHYFVLGIARTETPSGIRAAYRDRARELHPDLAGDASTRAFQELTEAYHVLSDPGRRSAYNAQLAADTPTPLPTSILSHPETLHPSFEEVYERFLRNFTRLHVPKAERPVALEIEARLTREEAITGCTIPIGVPTFQRCGQCGGSGFVWSYACRACRRSGMVETERQVHVRIPPMPPPGSVYEIALGGLGIHNFRLRLHVFVET